MEKVNQIKELMHEHGISQTELANLTNRTKQNISDIFNGKTRLTHQKYMEFTDAILQAVSNTDPNIITKGPPDEKPGISAQELSRLYAGAIDYYRKLIVQQNEIILNLTNTIKAIHNENNIKGNPGSDNSTTYIAGLPDSPTEE